MLLGGEHLPVPGQIQRRKSRFDVAPHVCLHAAMGPQLPQPSNN